MAAVCQHAVDAHVHGGEHRQAADLAQTHKRAFQVAWVEEPVQEEAVKGKVLESARRAGVLVAVLIERRLAGRVERQTARPKLRQHMLGTQLRSARDGGAGELGQALCHAPMRQTRRGHARRFGNKALHARQKVQAKGVLDGLRLHKRGVFHIAIEFEPLAREHGSNGAGQHEHIAVEPQLDIRHLCFLST